MIDLRQSVTTVTAQIRACKHIISSSLHGLIVADAFQIPNSRMIVTDGIIGKNHKFEDYYSCFGLALPAALKIRTDTSIEKIQQVIEQNHVVKTNLISIQNQLRKTTVAMLTSLFTTLPDIAEELLVTKVVKAPKKPPLAPPVSRAIKTKIASQQKTKSHIRILPKAKPRRKVQSRVQSTDARRSQPTSIQRKTNPPVKTRKPTSAQGHKPPIRVKLHRLKK